MVVKGKSSYRERQARATRERIAQAARALFRERGYVATTIESIAASAGVAVPTVYSAFGSKKAILEEIRRVWIDQAEVRELFGEALREPDFRTASRVALAINTYLREGAARVIDPGSVKLTVPEKYKTIVPELMAEIEGLPIETDVVARVVINERTGTVVVGGNVRISPAAVAHGNLSVRITTRLNASQPLPYSKGQTVVVPNSQVDVNEGTAKLVALEEGVTLESVVGALNALGASPRDIIAIVQALKAAGALSAEIVIL